MTKDIDNIYHRKCLKKMQHSLKSAKATEQAQKKKSEHEKGSHIYLVLYTATECMHKKIVHICTSTYQYQYKHHP